MGDRRSGSVAEPNPTSLAISTGSKATSPRMLRKFTKNTPSTKDLDIQKLIKNHPFRYKDVKVECSDNHKKETKSIIAAVNRELSFGNTRKYSNYVNMGMLAEQFTID